jgi:NADPH:quinone reductase-like Zn-dependent oxidoreductase
VASINSYLGKSFTKSLPPWSFVMALLWVAAGLASLCLGVWCVSRLIGPKRFKLNDKVVVITGGSSGIGLAVAQVCWHRRAVCVTLARQRGVALCAGSAQGRVSRCLTGAQRTHA